MPYRIERVNELIKQVLGRIILEEEDFGAGVLITIMEVHTSVDFQHARILISIFPSEKREAVLEALNRDVFELQQLLNKNLKMRPVPKIKFTKF